MTAGKNQKWNGYYSHGGSKHPMAFDLFVVRKKLKLIKGHGRDDVGEFDINGIVEDNEKDIKFIKYYLGAHFVTYEGKLENGKKKITGKWTLEDGMSDSFEITRA